MPRSARLTFLSLSLFLVLFPLGIVRPGLPPTLKADEPAYYGMALSLAHDFDVVCDLGDVRRLVNAYPYLPVNNLILLSDDGWESAYFGKPYVFSLLAAPAVRMFGEHGMVAVNMLLLLAMVWMGAVYLKRFNDWTPALLFSAGFFIASTAFVYVFWLQPEIFNMFSIMACLFLAFHRPEPTPKSTSERSRWLRVVGSGAVLALAVYNKPVFALLGIPALWVVWRRRGLKAAGAWIAAAVVAMAILAGGGIALTGHPSAYLGAARGGVQLDDPITADDYLEDLREWVELREDENPNAWTWIFRIPEVDGREFKENLGYFFWGRHTGLLLYTPLAALAFFFFVSSTPRSLPRWMLVVCLALVGLFFLVFIPFNWHGGGGFVGNRYFINVYPAFLFLITRIRPIWTIPLAFVLGAVTAGPMIFTPFGAPVPNPTLQAHTRHAPFRWFPLELSIRRSVPGYDGTNLGGVRLVGRADLVRTFKKTPGQLWLHGATDGEIVLLSRKPVERLLFEVQTLAAENTVRLTLDGETKTVRFGADGASASEPQVIEMTPETHDRVTVTLAKASYAYKMQVETEAGMFPRDGDGKPAQPLFFFGASLRYLGQREQLEGPAHHQVEWGAVAASPTVAPGETLRVLANLTNIGETPWNSGGPVPVNLAYHWLDEAGQVYHFEGSRTSFADEVDPQESVEVLMMVEAPGKPGRYRLQLDLVRENVAWFSRRGAKTTELEIEVTPVAETGTP